MKITESKIREIIREEVEFVFSEAIDQSKLSPISMGGKEKKPARNREDEEGGAPITTTGDESDEESEGEPEESFKDAFNRAREEGRDTFEYDGDGDGKAETYHTKHPEEMSQGPGKAPVTEPPRTDHDFSAQPTDLSKPEDVVYADQHAKGGDSQLILHNDRKKRHGGLCFIFNPVYEDTGEEAQTRNPLDFEPIAYIDGKPAKERPKTLAGGKWTMSEMWWFEISTGRRVVSNPKCNEVTPGWESTVINWEEWDRDEHNALMDKLDLVLLSIAIFVGGSTYGIGDILTDTASAGLMLLKDPPDYVSAGIILGVTATIVGNGQIANRLRKAGGAGARVVDDALSEGTSIGSKEFSDAISDHVSPEDITAGRKSAQEYLDKSTDTIYLHIRDRVPPARASEAREVVDSAKKRAMQETNRLSPQRTSPGSVGTPVVKQTTTATISKKIDEPAKLSYYQSPEMSKEFGADITDFVRDWDGKLPLSAEGTVFLAKSRIWPTDVAIKIIDKPGGVADAGVLSSPAWILRNRDKLPSDLAESLPRVYKIGSTVGPDGKAYDYIVMEKLVSGPAKDTIGNINTQLNPGIIDHYYVGRGSEMAPDIMKNPDQLHSFAKRYDAGFKSQQDILKLYDPRHPIRAGENLGKSVTPETDAVISRIKSDRFSQEFASDVIKYTGDTSRITGPVKQRLDNVDWKSDDIYGFAGGYSLSTTEINMLKSISAARVNKLDNVISHLQQARRNPDLIPTMTKDEISRSLAIVKSERKKVIQDIGDTSYHAREAERMEYALDYNPAITRDYVSTRKAADSDTFVGRQSKRSGDIIDIKAADAPFDPDLDPVVARAEYIDKELARRGFFRVDVRDPNKMFRADVQSPNPVQADITLNYVLQPGQKIMYKGEPMTIVDPSTPLDRTLEMPKLDPTLRPNPQFDEEDIIKGTKYNPLEEGIDLDRWLLIAGILE